MRRLRFGTPITLQYWGMLGVIFAALAGLAAYVAFRVWRAFVVGEVTMESGSSNASAILSGSGSRSSGMSLFS
jgi:hypothetical protein